MHPTLGLHFLAAAEATDDPYEDAPCAGSALGCFDAAFFPRLLARLRPDLKAEGLAWWEPPGGPGRWLVVADADDARTGRRSMSFCRRGDARAGYNGAR